MLNIANREEAKTTEYDFITWALMLSGPVPGAGSSRTEFSQPSRVRTQRPVDSGYVGGKMRTERDWLGLHDLEAKTEIIRSTFSRA